MMHKHFHIILLLMVLLAGSAALAQPKREFRAVWVPTVGDRYYAQHSTEECKAYLVNIIDSAKIAGCNAVIFHCRPQADAFYPSQLEPWSYWLTGTAGQAPSPMWDPMQLAAEECHKRGMELHAWINPYRVGYDHQIADSALARQHPEWFIRYGKQLYFDPAVPQCRQHICRVVADIVRRYDIDALHMDDFFYPYPIKDQEFPDTASYDRWGLGWDKAAWRRANVDSLIRGMHDTIASIKPWVRLGISPFGIWRNKSTDPDGSNTSGFQCYDGLYADCPKWVREGWVDYLVPQLYWQMEHKLASDSVLMDWWNEHANGRGMYYGLAIRNTMDYADTRHPSVPTQLGEKMERLRSLPNVGGVVWWPCYDLTGNYKGVADSLITRYQHSVALPPAYPWLSNTTPEAPEHVGQKKIDGQKCLTWHPVPDARFYAVYCLSKGDKAAQLVALTGSNNVPLKEIRHKGHSCILTVTALSRTNVESQPSKPKKIKF